MRLKGITGGYQYDQTNDDTSEDGATQDKYNVVSDLD